MKSAIIQDSADTLLQTRIWKKISEITEIKEADKYIDSISKHKNHIAFLWDGYNKDSSVYVVQAGYDNDIRFENYYWLYVNPKTLQVKFYDVGTDSAYTVEDFRKLKK
ncbi:MAG: hypothetical protein HY252_13185 [Sphingobacteriales bacterium]|nr:hypothetical protein [Sphingobacteriales bacterium]